MRGTRQGNSISNIKYRPVVTLNIHSYRFNARYVISSINKTPAQNMNEKNIVKNFVINVKKNIHYNVFIGLLFKV